MLGGGNRKEMARYVAIGQVGLEMAAPPALGIYLDSVFGWTPWAVVVGAAVGLTVGLIHLISLANKKDDEGPAPSDERKPL